jgi:peptidoglycan hydrolase CwlO-like protein
MIKKVLIGSAIAVVAGFFFFGKGLFSYARTAANEIRESVRGEVPLDFEVKRARDEVEALVPDIRKCMQLVAEQQVNIGHLETEVERHAGSLESQKQAIVALRNHLASGAEQYVSFGREYSQDEVRRDLHRKLERFELSEEELDRDRKVLSAHRNMLAANQQKLDEMLSAKRDLEVQIVQLEARLKTLQAAEAASALEFDDSQLARAKKLIGELNKQLDVRAAMLEAEGKFTDGIPVETESEPAPVDILERIDAKFGGEIDPVALKPAA